MARRILAWASAAGLAGIGWLALPSAGAPASASRQGPVILYLVDTLRFDRMSAYGARRDTTPAALRLAEEGVRYDTAYSVCTWTRPAVASLFTSRLPADVGAIERAGVLVSGPETLAEAFRAGGYRTASFCGNPNISAPPFGFARGFEVFRDSTLPIPRLGPADLLVGPAVSWIESQPDPGFLLFVHVVDPHAPYDHFRAGYERLFAGSLPAAASDAERALAEYDGLVRQADDQFSRLRAALERRGFWKDALVLYLADHGEQFLEHGGRFHGDTLFEETLRIPLIVRGPRWGRPGSVVKTPVSLLDLLPSLAHWAGLPVRPEWQGRPLDAGPPKGDRELYFSEELDGARLYGLRRGSRKVIVSMNPPFRIEFDLARDPGEQSPREADAELSGRLERVRAFEIARYGGLWIHRAGAEPLRLFGILRDLDPADPFLLWSDRGRFPDDLASPETLRLDRRLARGEPFDLHVTRFDAGTKLPTANLSAEEDGAVRTLEVNAPSGSPVQVLRRPMTPLSEAEQAEAAAKMRALGYLGGSTRP